MARAFARETTRQMRVPHHAALQARGNVLSYEPRHHFFFYNDPTWRGQTKGDAKTGYKVGFDGVEQFQQANLSGKKHVILWAQIVPGAPAAAMNMRGVHMTPFVGEVASVLETKRLVLGQR